MTPDVTRPEKAPLVRGSKEGVSISRDVSTSEQSQARDFNPGQLTVLWTGDDPEWDVEYDYDSFEWASIGHSSEEIAHSSWKGANPGGYWSLAYNDNIEECEKYDEMARECLENNRNSSGYFYTSW